MDNSARFDATIHSSTLSCCPILWSSIFAGVLISLMVTTLLNLLGVSLGLASFAVHTDIYRFGMTTVAWLMLTVIVAMAAGGWVSARITPHKLGWEEGSLYGLMVWGVTSLLTLLLMLSAMGMLIGGTAGMIEKGILSLTNFSSNQAQQVKNFIPSQETLKNSIPNGGVIIDKIQQEAGELIQDQKNQAENTDQNSLQMNNSKESLNQVQKAVTNFLQAIHEGDDLTNSRQQLINALSQTTHIRPEKIAPRVYEWEQMYRGMEEKTAQTVESTKEKAIDIASDTRKYLAEAAFISFLNLLIGAFSAAFGGAYGVRR